MQEFDVIISPKAENEIRNAVHYLAFDQCEPEAARRLADLLFERIGGLAHFPERFPMVDTIDRRLRGTRKMTVGSYLVFYRIHPRKQTVEIAHVLHGHSNWKQTL